MIVTIGATLSAPAQAQTYDPNFPVCIQTYGITGNYIGCSFTSMDQCRLSASGRAAQCISQSVLRGGTGAAERPRVIEVTRLASSG